MIAALCFLRGGFMNATLYTNNSPKENVSKSLTQVATATINLLEQTSITNPKIVYEGADINFDYIYIQELGRYYYVVEAVSLVTGIWQITCKEDVLETYASQIKNHSALIERQEFTYNPYLKDNLVPMANDTEQYIKKFTNGIEFTDTYNVILVNPYIDYRPTT